MIMELLRRIHVSMVSLRLSRIMFSHVLIDCRASLVRVPGLPPHDTQSMQFARLPRTSFFLLTLLRPDQIAKRFDVEQPILLCRRVGSVEFARHDELQLFGSHFLSLMS